MTSPRELTAAGRAAAGLAAGTPVTVRHRVPVAAEAAAERPVLADVVATVTAVDAARIRLRRGDGTPVSVRLDAITAVRVLPRTPLPGRPVDPLTLERVAAAGWPATETAWLGNWLLRASGGWTHRGNSALVLGVPDRPLPAALAACRQWYAARGLVAQLSVPGVPGALGPGDPLAEHGDWQPEVPTAVLVARSADVLAAADPEPVGPRVDLTAAAGPAWLADYRDAATHLAAAGVLAGPPAPARVRFAEARTGPADPAGDGPALAARGRAVTLDGWVGLTAVGVRPESRRAGLGRTLAAALLADGLRHGGVRTYVEVEQDNVGARSFWERLGYRRSHDSRYYRDLRPPTAPEL